MNLVESNKLRCYRVYGLNIKSEIEIKEFIEVDNLSNEDIDVNYLYGEMPDKFKMLRKSGETGYFNYDEVWFDIKGVASYYISNGNKVIIERYDNSNNEMINIFLMCSCLGFIMIQRNKLAIHGSAVVVNNKAIVLTGGRGAGKSTLSTALRLKGYKFLADDVAAITLGDKINIEYGFPYQKLCEDTAINLGYDVNEYISFISNTEEKYIVPAYDEFVYKAKELGAIFEIISDSYVSEVIIEEIKGNEKLNKIIKNIYRAEFLPYMGGITPSCLKKCIEISKQIKFYKIIRPKDKFTVDEQVKALEEILINDEDKILI